jgi:hypothetical protein
MKVANKISLFCSTSSARYLAAYLVDLILVLHEISMTVGVDPPRSLTSELVQDALATYVSGSAKIHAQVKEMALTPDVEEKVAKMIRDALHM